MTRPTSPEGCVVKYQEPEIDEPISFRIANFSRPDARQLGEGLTRQISGFVHKGHHHRSQSLDCEKQTLPDEQPLYVCSLSSSFIFIYFRPVFIGRV